MFGWLGPKSTYTAMVRPYGVVLIRFHSATISNSIAWPIGQ